MLAFLFYFCNKRQNRDHFFCVMFWSIHEMFAKELVWIALILVTVSKILWIPRGIIGVCMCEKESSWFLASVRSPISGPPNCPDFLPHFYHLQIEYGGRRGLPQQHLSLTRFSSFILSPTSTFHVVLKNQEFKSSHNAKGVGWGRGCIALKDFIVDTK